MKKATFILQISMLCLLLSSMAMAARPTGFGGMATNMLEPVNLLSDFVNSACFLIGGSFLFASIIKYVEHRNSPLMVPISTVVFLFLAGIILILLPFAYMLTENGIHYSLLRK